MSLTLCDMVDPAGVAYHDYLGSLVMSVPCIGVHHVSTCLIHVYIHVFYLQLCKYIRALYSKYTMVFGVHVTRVMFINAFGCSCVTLVSMVG
jgi:hypothetical protein